MSKDRLVVEYHSGSRTYGIQWAMADGDMGAWLCESPNDGKGPPPKDRGNYEHWLANRLARGLSDEDTPGKWEFEAPARRALKAIRTQLALPRELPEWAKTALEAGWTPPKGWKP